MRFIDAELVAERSRMSLRARQCGGCNMSIDASEISRIRSAAADEVIRCEECQRILVRTDESGL